MTYPKEIQPSFQLKKIRADLSDYYLIRFTLSKKDIMEESPRGVAVKHLAMRPNTVEDLSTSLFSIFNVNHIPIKIIDGNGMKQYFESYCNADDKVGEPIFNFDYEIKEERGCFFLPIKDINNRDVSFPNEKITAMVLHTPTRWNYWHFSVRFFINGISVLEEPNNQLWNQKVSKVARAFIAQFGDVVLPSFPKLSEAEYKKNYIEIIIFFIKTIFKLRKL